MTDPIMKEEVLRRVGETHLKLLYTIWEKKKRQLGHFSGTRWLAEGSDKKKNGGKEAQGKDVNYHTNTNHILNQAGQKMSYIFKFFFVRTDVIIVTCKLFQVIGLKT